MSAYIAPGRQHDQPASSERLISMQTLQDARVMIVDDEPATIHVVQVFLEDAGYSHFITTNDSTQALDIILKQRPDILILDLCMPGKSGFELLGEIRSDPLLRYLPVLVFSAAGDAATKLHSLELGATDFLPKPVDPSELVLRLRNALAFKAYQDQLAYNDRLTGLPNRQLFLERLSWTLRLAQRHSKQCALLQIGLDRFKQINDTLGHEVGDKVLKAVSHRLTTSLRESDTISQLNSGQDSISLSRLSGDEFMVLTSEINHAEDASLIARRLLEAMKLPLALGKLELFVTISVGIALFPQDGSEGSALLTHVDLAMAQAKLHGRNTYAFHSVETNTRSFERLNMETALRKSIERKELELHYQPKVDLNTGRIIGAEALARWTHAELGQVSPAQFIPLSEETGLILPLGEDMLNLACQEAVKWQKIGCNLPVSVNVSSMQFRRGDMPSIIRSALQASGLQPENLMIELTESLLMENAQSNIDMLRAIKNLGVQLSMDDFGTGYSSLSYLKRFPLDELKIDQVFVSDLPDDSGSAAIVSSVINMAHGLGLKVTAEGVETAAQMAALKSDGCDHFQGYLFSRPLAPPDFAALLRQKAHRSSITHKLSIAS
ncbi:MAG: EAL domain-containing protein [Thiobacillus sp.]|nr:EAL domain-containing protein [Thiobacillus sp.]